MLTARRNYETDAISNNRHGELSTAPAAENTMKKPTLSREEADELIRWAVRDQVDARPLRALVFGPAQLRERSASESLKTAAKQ